MLTPVTAAAVRLSFFLCVLGLVFGSRAANFDFARYASLVTDRQILGMANISFSSWLALLVLQWITYGLQKGLAADE